MNNLKELNLNELEQVNGGNAGSFCVFIGFSSHVTANACVAVGVGAQDEDDGFGVTACALVGVGMGGSFRHEDRDGDIKWNY